MKYLLTLTLFTLLVACLGVSCKENTISPAKQLSLSEAIIGAWAYTGQIITNCDNPNQNSNFKCPVGACETWLFYSDIPGQNGTPVPFYEVWNYHIDSTAWRSRGHWIVSGDSLILDRYSYTNQRGRVEINGDIMYWWPKSYIENTPSNNPCDVKLEFTRIPDACPECFPQ